MNEDEINDGIKILATVLDGLQDDNYIRNYEKNLVDLYESDGFNVSTVNTSDMGYETAICDKEGVHPVERYENREQAKKGHDKWIEYVKNYNGWEVKELGYGVLCESEKIILIPKVKKNEY